MRVLRPDHKPSGFARRSERLDEYGAEFPTQVPGDERRSQFYSAADLKGKAVPPREWLLDGLVPNKTVTLLSGDGGTGKSLLAQLACGRCRFGLRVARHGCDAGPGDLDLGRG